MGTSFGSDGWESEVHKNQVQAGKLVVGAG